MRTIPEASAAINSAVSSITITYAANSRRPAEQPIRTELMAGLTRCMSRLVGGRTDVTLLDLGCGTGLFTIPLAKSLGYTIVGADCSRETLDVAGRKPQSDLVRWDQQDATSLTYEDGTFDIVFMSNLLDLVKNPSTVVSECYRVLKPGGVIVYHYTALEDILHDVEHKFFPETVELDYMRTPARKQVETWFKDTHLTEILSERNTYRLWKTSQERLEHIEEKSHEVLRMLSAESFTKGLNDLRAYASSSPRDPWLRDMTVTTTYGRK